MRCIAVLLLALLAFCAPAHAADTSANKPDNVVILEIAGSAETLSAGQTLWSAARTNQVLRPGERFRTRKSSRATLRLSDRSLLRVSEESEFQVLSPDVGGGSPIHKLWRGLIYFFHRDKPGTFRFDSPGASAAVRGTEFVMQADDAGRTVLTLLEGEVVLSNAVAQVDLRTGQQGTAEPGRAPTTTALLPAQLAEAVQWGLYYPGVLHLPEIALSEVEDEALRESMAAWREGDPLAALRHFPAGREPASEAGRLYRAGLLLAVGQTEPARQLLEQVREESRRGIAESLVRLIAAVQGRDVPADVTPATASALLAESYVRQSRSDLPGSLEAALEATRRAPDFGFAWARVAELEFSFGHLSRAEQSVARALSLAPRHAQALALRGFLAAARNDTAEAIGWFDRALAVDGALGNAWLGRGLCKIRRGRTDEGLLDLQTAATVEPQRALLRSYLGKGYEQANDPALAARELDLAVRLDAMDPTPWLYRALLERGRNRINPAISDLERSLALNDNRSLYRSRLLLDQDRAVRSSSLANLYQSAGLTDVSVREAARAVTADYANYSAHLFLSESFDALRDPTRFNLRYETPWFSELLLANLLSPVGGTPLSQTLSQQEYSRLFSRDRAGLSSSTEYRSDGQVRQQASQYGAFDRFAWALDLDYQHNDGVRPNNDLDRIEWYTTLKYQVSDQDSLLVLTKYQDYSSGDNFQYFDPDTEASRHYRFDETQQPIALAGWHREWAPGMHTLALGGYLQNDQQFSDERVPAYLLGKRGDLLFVSRFPPFNVQYENQFEAGTAELNQIFQTEHHTLVVGGRYQRGTVRAHNEFVSSDPPSLSLPPVDDSIDEDFERGAAYAYYTFQPAQSLALLGGLAYDHVTFPSTYRNPPITPGTDDRDLLGPKAALTWAASKAVTVRGAYSRSLGGVTLDQNFRLEPTQLAGFVQTYRTLIPESAASSINAQETETAGLALDLKLARRTYLGLTAERLASDVKRQIGVFLTDASTLPPPPAHVSSTRESLDYLEYSAGLSLNQLVSDEWSFGFSYRFSRARLESRLTDIDATPFFGPDRSDESDLHRFGLFALYNLSGGFFARGELDWYLQENRTRTWNGSAMVDEDLPGDEFPQLNLFAGWRFPGQRGDVTVGVMNLTGEDYHLNPLNFYSELPRERVFYARLRWRF